MITDSYRIDLGSGGYYFLSSFGEWLKTARLARGFSTTDLAEAAGVSQPLITAYENGKRNPRRDTVEKIAQALSSDADAFHRVLEEALRQAGFIPTQEITREVFTADTLEVAHMYNGIANAKMRSRIKELIKTAVEITDQEPPDAGPSGDGSD